MRRSSCWNGEIHRNNLGSPTDPIHYSVRQNYQARGPARSKIKAQAIAKAREIDDATYGSGKVPPKQAQPEIVFAPGPGQDAKAEQSLRMSSTKRVLRFGRWAAKLRMATRRLTCGFFSSVDATFSEQGPPFYNRLDLAPESLNRPHPLSRDPPNECVANRLCALDSVNTCAADGVSPRSLLVPPSLAFP